MGISRVFIASNLPLVLRPWLLCSICTDSPGHACIYLRYQLSLLCHLLLLLAMAITAGPLPMLSSMVDPMSRARRGETPLFAYPDHIQPTPRFTTLKETLTSGKEPAVSASWQRLLRDLPGEVDAVSTLGSQAIPTISFTETAKPRQAERFLRDLRQRGVGIIRNVVSRDTALAWSRETEDYLKQNPQARPDPANHAQSHDVFWSPGQVKARAHPEVLAAQRFVMSIWKSTNPTARVATDFPISYADRMMLPSGAGLRGSPCAYVNGGSVERWEPDGYGRAGTYKDIFQGRWEDYDPWEVRIPLADPSLPHVTDTFRRHRAAPA